MKECEIIEIIKNQIGSEFIGDDCAYLPEIGIVITQDSLIENVHFKREWYTPFQLGYKSITVNLSDVIASGANPKYITISLSFPNDISEDFINDFYAGAKSALHGAKIVGGDITGSQDAIMISIAAIGITKNKNISSRKNAKPGHIIITKGYYGSSAAGLKELFNNGRDKELILSHIQPQLDYEFAEKISTTVKEPYAMMDSSDGLADALFKIADASNVKMIIDYDKIKHHKYISKDFVLFGGEDYNLVASVPEKYADIFDNSEIIGKVVPFDGVRLDISGDKFSQYNELNVFDHFCN